MRHLLQGMLLGSLLACALLMLAPPALATVPVVGSKNFTESVVLATLARTAGRQHGVQVQLRPALGGTRIVWRALREGDIDAYPEYTGTLTHELLPNTAPDASIAALRKRLHTLGIGMTDPLGFNNTYALGMRETEAKRLHIARISDLRAHPQLKLAFSNEFMNRADGWPGLRRAYRLPMHARGMSHDLAYRALASGAIDVTDLYRTDAEIAYYHLRVLKDDLHYFPRYDAVYLYRLDLRKRAPQFIAALQSLSGRIDEEAMRSMNKAVKIDHQSPARVTAGFLSTAITSHNDNGFWQRLYRRTLEHLVLVGVSLSLALLLALPLGVLAARERHVGQIVIALTGILQTVPTLAMFVFMIPLFGIGAAPAIAALFLYSLLPIVRNTHAGLSGIAPELRESAAALGLPRRTRLWRIELPLALSTILAGVKIAAVINVGTAALGALIGAGGYGQPILAGIRLDDISLILQGAIPAAILALLVQGFFEIIERLLTPCV